MNAAVSTSFCFDWQSCNEHFHESLIPLLGHKNMKALGVIVAIALLAPSCKKEDKIGRTEESNRKERSELTTGEEEPNRNDGNRDRTVAFTGKVNRIYYLNEFSGKATIADIDPRFVIEIEIFRESPSDDPFYPGSRQYIAVHSPTHVFYKTGSSTSYEGREFAFSIKRKGDGRWTGLRAEVEMKK